MHDHVPAGAGERVADGATELTAAAGDQRATCSSGFGHGCARPKPLAAAGHRRRATGHARWPAPLPGRTLANERRLEPGARRTMEPGFYVDSPERGLAPTQGHAAPAGAAWPCELVERDPQAHARTLVAGATGELTEVTGVDGDMGSHLESTPRSTVDACCATGTPLIAKVLLPLVNASASGPDRPRPAANPGWHGHGWRRRSRAQVSRSPSMARFTDVLCWPPQSGGTTTFTHHVVAYPHPRQIHDGSSCWAGLRSIW